jgi:DHA3 family macrolide efflux protein-like MFS transporter
MVQVWHIYILVLARSAGGAFHWAAMQASTVFLVPQKHLARVAGLNQSLNGAMNIISPLLGAFFIGVVPMQGVLAIDIFTAILAIIPLLLVTIPQPEKRQTNPSESSSIWANVRDGFDFVRGWHGLRVMISVAMLSNFLLHPAISLSPLMITDHFKGGAPEIALFQSASGLGIVLGGLALGIWGGFKRKMVTALIMMLLMGASVIVIGLAPSDAFPAVALAMFIMMGTNAIANGALTALFQVIVPPEMQGRFFALLVSASSCVAPIGLAVAGPITDAIGVQTWFVVSGVILGVAAVGAFFHPPLKQLDAVPQPENVTLFLRK